MFGLTRPEIVGLSMLTRSCQVWPILIESTRDLLGNHSGSDLANPIGPNDVTRANCDLGRAVPGTLTRHRPSCLSHPTSPKPSHHASSQ